MRTDAELLPPLPDLPPTERWLAPGFGIVRLKGDDALEKYLNKRGRRIIVGQPYLASPSPKPTERHWICIVKQRWWKRL